MKDSWICRDYQSGDEYEILTLYQQVNNREMTLEHWKWKFAKNPFGEAVIKLMFDDKKLVGHYAVTPINVQVQNRLVKAVFSLNTMVHPDYRGGVIFAYLGKETYKVCEQKGAKFVYGFPNRNSYLPLIRKLGWVGCGKMSILQKELEGKASVASKATNIYEIDKFDTKVNSLWDKVKASYRVIVPRTKDFLNWRFTEHPTIEYSKYIITNNDNEILGYLILKIYTKGDEIKGHIVDMLCINNSDVVKSLLDYSYDYFNKKGIRNLSCWMPDSCFCTQVIKEDGFVTNEFETYFGVRIFDKEAKLLRNNVGQLDSWHLTMGDSDVI